MEESSLLPLIPAVYPPYTSDKSEEEGGKQGSGTEEVKEKGLAGKSVVFRFLPRPSGFSAPKGLPSLRPSFLGVSTFDTESC